MLETIRAFPEQFGHSYDQVQQVALVSLERTPITAIFLAGMGGSSLTGDLVNDYLMGNPPITIIMDYAFPRRLSGSDLVFCCSYSGNTEETLALYDQARREGAAIVVLAHGGRIVTKARADGVPIIPIPASVQPRSAAGNFFAAIVAVLERVKLVGPQQQSLLELADFLERRKSAQESLGKGIAPQLKNYLPIIYSTPQFLGTCRLLKIKMNENCKIPSFFNVFPEVNHNEMVGYTNLLAPLTILYLKSRSMRPRILERMDVMEQLLSDKMPFHSLWVEGKDHLQQIFDAVLLGDYVTYYLAKEYGVDPAPVVIVEKFKKLLS